jgi:hypothetical protein
MNLFEIEIGRKYKCDCQDGQYFATVKEKRDGVIGVVLGDKVGKIDDPGDLEQIPVRFTHSPRGGRNLGIPSR